MATSTEVHEDSLLQRAADELRDGTRDRDTWMRACRMAGRDHEEARFLYQSLRVAQWRGDADDSATSGRVDDRARPPGGRQAQASLGPEHAPSETGDSTTSSPRSLDELSQEITLGDDKRTGEPQARGDRDDLSMREPEPGAGSIPASEPAGAATRAPAFPDSTRPRRDPGSLPPIRQADRDRAGRLFEVFRRDDGSFRAAARGSSWSATFFTLPWLLARGLLGTALIYALLWLVLVGGLAVIGLLYLDGGGRLSEPVAALAAAYALMAIIGLLWLPFTRANAWHRRHLEKRGFRLLRPVEATDHREAIERVRRPQRA